MSFGEPKMPLDKAVPESIVLQEKDILDCAPDQWETLAEPVNLHLRTNKVDTSLPAGARIRMVKIHDEILLGEEGEEISYDGPLWKIEVKVPGEEDLNIHASHEDLGNIKIKVQPKEQID